MAAKIAEAVISIEEQGLAFVSSAADVTAHSRIRLEKVELDPEDKSQVFVVYRRPPFVGDHVPFEKHRLDWTMCNHTRSIGWVRLLAYSFKSSLWAAS